MNCTLMYTPKTLEEGLALLCSEADNQYDQTAELRRIFEARRAGVVLLTIPYPRQTFAPEFVTREMPRAFSGYVFTVQLRQAWVNVRGRSLSCNPGSDVSSTPVTVHLEHL